MKFFSVLGISAACVRGSTIGNLLGFLASNSNSPEKALLQKYRDNNERLVEECSKWRGPNDGCCQGMRANGPLSKDKYQEWKSASQLLRRER
jgi:hypothetical protein